jgi:membrane fusion protein (multidrug efflux system)
MVRRKHKTMIEAKWRGRAFRAAAAVTVGVLLLTGCGGPPGSGEGAPQETPEDPRVLPVEAVTVTEGQLIRTIEASGTVAGIREALVVSETQGIVEEVRFELGEYVEKGEVLVQVDDEIARLNMEQAREQLETARIDFNTKQNLVERGGASRAEVARARSALRGAEARYQQAVDAYENCSISTPISGSVAGKEAAASIGNYLNPGMQIARITDLSRLQMEVSLGEGVISLVAPGAAAEVVVPAACGTVMEAEVTAVAAGSDPSTGSFTAVLEWNNQCPETVKSGMSAEAVIEPRRQTQQLLIPTVALTSRGGNQVVFTVEDGKAVMQPVETGRGEGNLTIVRSGLSAGDTVVLSGISGLSEGDPVNPTIVGESGEWR